MNSKNFIYICSWIVVVVVVAGVLTGGFFIYKDHITANKESEPLYPQKTIELLDTYKIVTPLVVGSDFVVYSKMYVVHDNDRNVTCYLYDDGISCIPDRFLEEVV